MRSIVIILFLSLVIACSSPGKPNFILFLADDLGYGDVGFTGGTGADTPNLDHLAKQSLILTDFHSNGSVCSPTRAALMTGRYQHRSGVVNVLGQTGNAMKQIRPEKPFLGLELEETTIPEVLAKAGYVSGMFGKWHLGPFATHGPNAQGFDVMAGHESHPGNYFTYTSNDKNRFYRGDHQPAPGESGQYYTDKMADEACKFIDKNKDQPFFIYIPFSAPHVPYWGTNDHGLEWDGNKYGPRPDRLNAYYEMVEAVDKAVGQIVDALEKAGLADETFIIFTSDNGPIDYGSAEPWTGRKSNLYEGATRVPTLFYWPGKIKPGASDTLSATMDILPTYMELADIPSSDAPPLDGVSMADHFLDGTELEPRLMFWEKPHGVHMHKFDHRRFAVRDGDWKLLDDGTDRLNLALFDLSTDPKESIDVSEAHPERVERMHEAFLEWKQDVYADAPYGLETVITELKEVGIIKPRSK